ncbi:20037_t:CDS:2, partial [Gigaspora margarita]
HLVETFLGFLELYKNIKNTEPCKQIFDVEIAIFLDTFLDCVETTNKDKSNKYIAYQVIDLIFKAYEYTYVCHTYINKQRDTEPQLP